MYICILKARKKDITKFKNQLCILYQFTVEICIEKFFVSKAKDDSYIVEFIV